MGNIDTAIKSAAENCKDPYVLVKMYYFFLLYLSSTFLSQANHLPKTAVIEPLWPVFWSADLQAVEVMYVLAAIFATSSVLATLYTDSRWARVLAFVGFFQIISFQNSFGKISHSYHLLVLIGALLILLPEDTQTMGRRKKFFLVFWSCQAIILLTYSMAGLVKLGGFAVQLMNGQPHLFSIDALALHISQSLINQGVTSPIGEFFIRHEWLGPFFMLTAIYIQLFALSAAFIPELQKMWGLFLILFHLATVSIMDVNFAPAIIPIAIFLANSPFSKFGYGSLLKLPLVSWLLRQTKLSENLP